jgi:hypothetical protein
MGGERAVMEERQVRRGGREEIDRGTWREER